MLHVQGNRVNRDRLRQALQLTQSTSPNYWLLASLDAARQQMAIAGEPELERVLQLSHEVRSHVNECSRLKTLSLSDLAATPFELDPTRLVVDVSSLGLTGFAADEILHEELAVTAELPSLRQLAFILSIGNTQADGEHLVQALYQLVQRSPHLTQDLLMVAAPDEVFPDIRVPPMTPRDAFFADTQTISLEAAEGHICADPICPYPPGIPVLLPGESVTAAAINQLRHVVQAGGMVTGGADDRCTLIRVVTNRQ
jgi:arginine decarboxylase